MTNDNRFASDERRVHPAVRDVFVPACILLAPLMKDNDKTLSTSGFAMVHIVQGHFPELSGSEARIVIAAVERLHRENRLQALLEQYAHEQNHE
jgi:hypothetical protein